MEGGANLDVSRSHLSQWLSRRATDWVIPRFEPGARAILFEQSPLRDPCSHDPKDSPVRTARFCAAPSHPPTPSSDGCPPFPWAVQTDRPTARGSTPRSGNPRKMKKKGVPKPPVRVIEYVFIRHTRHTLLPPLVSVVVSEAPIFDFTTQPTVAQVWDPRPDRAAPRTPRRAHPCIPRTPPSLIATTFQKSPQRQNTMGCGHVMPCAGRCAVSRRPDHARGPFFV